MIESNWFGGDYSPEQWDEATWDEDIDLMLEANVNLVTLGVFAWSKLQPAEGIFDFGWLDRIISKLDRAGIRIDLATATASPPPWLTTNHPDVRPVTQDGVRLAQGSRQAYCPSSPIYRDRAGRLVRELVERYGDHPAVVLWHVNNEYGCHVSHCYCEVSAKRFREWLQRKYVSIAKLNHAWGTAFWSQAYGSFDQVDVPSRAPYVGNPGQLLDFDRFSNDELLECYALESAIIRAGSDRPITTNFMGFFKSVDYWAWAPHIDVISDDCYPDPADPLAHEHAAMTRDLMRSLAGGKPWILMEQAAGAVNWRARNARKRPGQMRAWSLQAWARGAMGILFFQWRQSKAGGERFHSAMLTHAGPQGRVFQSVRLLGEELRSLPVPPSIQPKADVAIMLDWQSWWSLEQPGASARLSYLAGIRAWYHTLHERNVRVDFVAPNGDLADYRAVIAPSLFTVSDDTVKRLTDYVGRGGSMLLTYQSAITDEAGHVVDGGALGGLRQVLGVHVDEFAPPAAPDPDGTAPSPAPSLRIRYGSSTGDGLEWAEQLIVDTAEVRMSFLSGELAGEPAATVQQHGAGFGWYVATLPDEDLRDALLVDLLTDAGVSVGPRVPGVEVINHGEVLVAINHSSNEVDLSEVDARFRDQLPLGRDRVLILPSRGRTALEPIMLDRAAATVATD